MAKVEEVLTTGDKLLTCCQQSAEVATKADVYTMSTLFKTMMRRLDDYYCLYSKEPPRDSQWYQHAAGLVAASETLLATKQ